MFLNSNFPSAFVRVVFTIIESADLSNKTELCSRFLFPNVSTTLPVMLAFCAVTVRNDSVRKMKMDNLFSINYRITFIKKAKIMFFDNLRFLCVGTKKRPEIFRALSLKYIWLEYSRL